MKIRANELIVVLVSCLVAILIYFLPLTAASIYFSSKTYSSIDKMPDIEYAIVFGAKVYPQGDLSEVVKQRADSAILLYRMGKVKKLFVSGTNRSNKEVEIITSYLINQGVKSDDIYQDYFGIDTNDTCKHFYAGGGTKALLISQGFHLPRAMFMCSKVGIEVYGARANNFSPIANTDILPLNIQKLRISRSVTEAGLLWSYLVGYYDYYSNEAENINPPIIKLED